MRQTTFYIPEFYDNYYMLTEFPVDGLMREVAHDVNQLINYILTYVIDRQATAQESIEIPQFLVATMQHIVTVHSANGGVYDQKTILDIKGQINQLVMEYCRELSATPGWFNHHIRHEWAHIGMSGVASPSLAVCVSLGEAKLIEGNHAFLDHKLTPQILGSLEMLVMRL